MEGLPIFWYAAHDIGTQRRLVDHVLHSRRQHLVEAVVQNIRIVISILLIVGGRAVLGASRPIFPYEIDFSVGAPLVKAVRP